MLCKNLMNTYKRDILIKKGAGRSLFDDKGKKYLDLVGGLGACSIGHSPKGFAGKINEQAETLINCSNLFFSEPQIKLSEKLCRLSGLEKCFFSNSGTESVEAAIKLARKHTRKAKIIAMENGFHGRTMGSLSATWNSQFKAKFEPLVPGFDHAVFGDVGSLKKKICKKTAAVLLEPIQGEAGIIIPPAGYLQDVYEICQKKNLLLILDEVQTGNGRTGKYFCFEHEKISPDIVVTAKGIANGLPLGVTISKHGIDFEPGDHASTFGGNALSCAAALQTIKVLERLIPKVEEKGARFLAGLKCISSNEIKDVRGKGLMLGMELVRDRKSKDPATAETAELVERAKDMAVLLGKGGLCGNVVRIKPPMCLTKEDADFSLAVFDRALGAIR